MGPIQIVPPGLMGLLQLKQLGKLPGVLNETVSEVIEMRDWFLTARRVGTLGLFGGNSSPLINNITQANLVAKNGWFSFAQGGGGAVTPVVPNNEIWYCEEMTVWGVLTAAASTLKFACALIGPSPSNADNQVLGVDTADLATAAVRAVACKVDRGFWAYPGDTFGIFVSAVTTATQETVNMNLRATRLPI